MALKFIFMFFIGIILSAIGWGVVKDESSKESYNYLSGACLAGLIISTLYLVLVK